MAYGYHGKILHINLSNQEMYEDHPDDIFYRKFTGGSVMATAYLLKHTPAGLDAFDERSNLMFFSGIMSGFDAPGLARFVICGKSPQTGGIGEARSEGPFAVALKKTGFDGIVLQGICSEPSILVIEDGKPRIEPAPELWGAEVNVCHDRLTKLYPGADTAIIGPAGENLVRFANVISNNCHQASRAGMGAVMGSKNLKAVVIVGGKLPAVFDPKNIQLAKALFQEKMLKNQLSMWQHDRPGFGVWIHTHGIDSAVCVNNYQTSKCDYLDEYQPEKFEPFYKGESPCPSCPNNCIKRYATDKDSEKSGGLHQEALGAFGPNLGNADIEKIVQANVLCNQYGMDPNSLGFTISFAQECVQEKILDDDGLNFSFSNDIDLIEITHRIAKRQGIGDLLAEGSYRAALKIGNGAEQYCMTVKSNEMTAFEARSQTNLALGFATAAVGPKYEICEHDWDFDTEVGWDHTLDYCRTIGILERIPMQYLGEDKVKNFRALNELWAAAEGLGMCLFATAPTRVYSLEDMAKLYRSITGFETSSHEIMRLGNIKNQLFRLYNIREGLTAADDKLPERFYNSPIDVGRLEGVKIDKQKFQQVINFYYDMMGWDQDGIPKKSTLFDLGLNEFAPLHQT